MTDDAPQSPAKITALHKQDRPIFDDEANLILGKKGFRRIDRLAWLHDHKTIGRHQFLAGRRLQEDWQLSKIENTARMDVMGSGGIPTGVLPDAKLDAGTRVKKAMACIPAELVTLTTLFLLPEDHPFSLERIASKVREDKRAVSYGIRIALSMLARHYGYST